MPTFGYLRVSTHRQDLSIEAQSEQVKRAAEYHGGSAGLELFAEPDTSGSIEFAKREQGAALIARTREAVQSGLAVTIIVPKVDRLGRDVIDINQTVRVFEQMGVRILFLDINVDTRTPMGRAFMQIAAVFAELELARIRERIQSALDQKRANGHLTGTVPFGWDAVETGEVTAKGVKVRKLVDNVVEQGWILKMAARRDSGWSYQSIANELNRHDVPTKRAGESLNLRGPGEITSLRVTLGRWQAGNVAKVLANQSVRRWLIK
ncbi:MAG TPA: recombinase family protein [Candidatus Acidoferrum sp.]|jgi:DNA invertase Pin-like site-specific DNA recombinase|nr:recombinase family protein [Candidatus Acidoferrum sp.]